MAVTVMRTPNPTIYEGRTIILGHDGGFTHPIALSSFKIGCPLSCCWRALHNLLHLSSRPRSTKVDGPTCLMLYPLRIGIQQLKGCLMCKMKSMRG